MARAIKAIETHYKGYHFRSRLEARWAVFFDALGIQWEYEHEGYDLDGEWYLPDFWLPDFSVGLDGSSPSVHPYGRSMFAEVKPIGGDFSKARRLCEVTDIPVWLCEGSPCDGNYCVISQYASSYEEDVDPDPEGGLVEVWGYPEVNGAVDDFGFKNGIYTVGTDQESMPEKRFERCSSIFIKEITKAVRAARSARFDR